MNKQLIRNYQIFCIIFTFILGTLLHFTYQLSGNNIIVAAFSAVNESVWEHLKLLFFPMLATTLIGIFYLGNKIPHYLCSKTVGIVSALCILVIFFYTYTGVIGKNIDFINISSFFITTVIGEFITYLLVVNNFKCNKKLATIILVILTSLFIVFTYFPPELGLFNEPIAEQQ